MVWEFRLTFQLQPGFEKKNESFLTVFFLQFVPYQFLKILIYLLAGAGGHWGVSLGLEQ